MVALVAPKIKPAAAPPPAGQAPAGQVAPAVPINKPADPWLVEGEVNLTYRATPPEDTKLTVGKAVEKIYQDTAEVNFNMKKPVKAGDQPATATPTPSSEKK